MVERYTNSPLEKNSASQVINFVRGEISKPIGIIFPIISAMHPRYIITSAIKEKISVVIIPRQEIPPKMNVEIASVALIAKTDAIIPSQIERKIACVIFFGFFIRLEVYSPSTIIPSVASADSQSDVENTAQGSKRQIRETATVRDVILSRVREKRNNTEAIITIKPARITETENPVRAIYKSMKIDVIATLIFFLTPNKESSLPIPNESIARCIPLSASI